MNPEDKVLLERTLKISEENNKLLRSMRSTARWAVLWGIIKIIILIVPFVIAYFYLEPQFGSISDSFRQAQGVLNTFK
ncbi:hypothetical protein KW796_00150 [Candidatus Parcubacteria bacterium]|nr:hypothetical protein [Candidatus Parcubacteria bacterium]